MSDTTKKEMPKAMTNKEPRLRKKKKFDYIDVVAHTLLILFSICILYPMLHVVAVAFSGKGPIDKNIVTIIPLEPTLKWCQELIGEAMEEPVEEPVDEE